LYVVAIIIRIFSFSFQGIAVEEMLVFFSILPISSSYFHRISKSDDVDGRVDDREKPIDHISSFLGARRVNNASQNEINVIVVNSERDEKIGKKKEKKLSPFFLSIFSRCM
jgi:hypothetical protein